MDELLGWWEDLHDCSTGSQLARLVVPPGWGRSTVLEVVANRIVADDSRAGAVLWVDGGRCPEDRLAGQVTWLHDELDAQHVLPRIRSALQLDRSEGVAEAGLGAAALFGVLNGLPELVAGLPASAALKIAATARDRSEAGLLAQVTRFGNAIASYSVSLPVALMIDGAELLDPALVERLTFTVLDRVKSNVLTVVAVAPGAPVLERFAPRERYGPRWERIGSVDVDAAMDELARRRMIEAQTTKGEWPAAAVDRLAARTRTFRDVWAVLGVPAADDVPHASSREEQLRLVDALTSEVIDPGAPPLVARALALAGGVMHEGQLAAAVTALGGKDAAGDSNEGKQWLSYLRHAVRFAHPAYRVRAERSASVLSLSQRSAIALAVAEVAHELCSTRRHDATSIELVSALRPVLHLAEQEALAPGVEMVELLVRLARELERLGDIADALRVAKVALNLVDNCESSSKAVMDRLAAMVLRLGRLCGDEGAADRAAEWAQAMEGGALVGLEAAAWTAISLLDRRHTRPAGARILDSLVEELTDKERLLGAAGNEWRLLLAFHAGRAGYLSLAEQLLSPLLGVKGVSDQAYQVLNAVSGAGGADLRLYRQALLAEYGQLEADSDPGVRLAIVEALASIASRLGAFAQALQFGSEELTIRLALFDAEHPDTLITRANVAAWTGEVGDAGKASSLFEALVPDMTRVLGPDNRNTLIARTYLAAWTGRAGDAGEALARFEALLPDMTRVLGPDDPGTLSTRNHLAAWTGRGGDPGEALALFEALLPDVTRVLGPDHPGTLSTRNNIAALTGTVRDAGKALALFKALLPDVTRVLGPDHPQTLRTRGNIASWTASAGDAGKALALLEALLPDLTRGLGPNHPDTLLTKATVESIRKGPSDSP